MYATSFFFHVMMCLLVCKLALFTVTPSVWLLRKLGKMVEDESVVRAGLIFGEQPKFAWLGGGFCI